MGLSCLVFEMGPRDGQRTDGCVIFLPRNAMHSADYAVARCLSVRLSITRRYSVETVQRITNFFHRIG